MEPEEGTPLWRLQKLPAELGPQVRRAQRMAVLGRLPGGQAFGADTSRCRLAQASQGREREEV